MKTSARSIALLAALALTDCSDSMGPEAIIYDWTGVVAPGHTVEIIGINGTIEAFPTDEDTVRVTTTKRSTNDDPDLVRIVDVPDAGDVTICAVYRTAAGQQLNKCPPDPIGQVNECDLNPSAQVGAGYNDVQVDFAVHVPEGVHLVVRNVNGMITAEGMRGWVDLSTVNGAVQLSTSGVGQASTVNGSVVGILDVNSLTEAITFAAVNGDVTVELPEEVDANVTLKTTNGTMTSAFSGQVWGPGTESDILGNGGSDLTLCTVNGDVRLLHSK